LEAFPLNRQNIKTMNTFEQELCDLINRRSQENASNTPDFILAQYLSACLLAYNTAVQQRETWYGRDASPSLTPLTLTATP
jgi:hypothetical protein